MSTTTDFLTGVAKHLGKPATTTMRKGKVETPMTAVYDGQRCVGFILNRGPQGFEAFDADEQSMGCFPTAQEAARAIPNPNSHSANDPAAAPVPVQDPSTQRAD